ncbi:MAG: hypothetical protein SGI77_21575 [Pirellulaceae bacterium]|nr:hypothetical protein [Pirellulaceae bacterium]
MRGSGGTDGGIGLFSIGFVLSAVSLYFFFDSVHVTAGGFGALTSMIHRGMGQGAYGTASMGIVFVPFFLGVLALFYDARPTWAWYLMWAGLGILVIEILSGLRFFFDLRASHLLILLGIFAAGAGMMLRSYRSIDIPPN